MNNTNGACGMIAFVVSLLGRHVGRVKAMRMWYAVGLICCDMFVASDYACPMVCNATEPLPDSNTILGCD
jgi:hypothetical protein